VSYRTKLIYLLSFNAILASIGVVLITLLLTSGAQINSHLAICSARDDGPADLTPINSSFESIDEAEVFICHKVVYPRLATGWILEHISASRAGPAAYVGRGIGFASVTLDYGRLSRSSADLRIEVSPFHIDPVSYGVVDRIDIMGAKANLIQATNDPNLVILQWEARGFSFYVEARLQDGFELDELYAILNSIR
jgi:hypothetical protein